MFYTADWLSDQAVRKCSLAARGAWFDMLCMMDKDDDYQVEGTVLELSRMIGCSWDEAHAAIIELVDKGACDFEGDIAALHVTGSDTHVTLVSRRLQRERKAKAGNALRQRKKRAQDTESRKSNAPSSCSASTAPSTTTKTSSAEAPEDGGSAGKSSVPYKAILDAWNDIVVPAGGKKAITMNDKRKAALRARWRQPHWRETWREAMCALPSRPWALGKNDINWHIPIDKFLEPGLVTEILEGKYSEREAPPKPKQHRPPADVLYDD